MTELRPADEEIGRSLGQHGCVYQPSLDGCDCRCHEEGGPVSQCCTHPERFWHEHHDDPEPQPTDGPDYHADHQAWTERQLRSRCSMVGNPVFYGGKVRCTTEWLEWATGRPSTIAAWVLRDIMDELILRRAEMGVHRQEYVP